MRLAIADPPYPPHAEGKPRASRWYGNGQLASDDRPADVHADASAWDDPAQHRRLILDLLDGFDGFAIATSPDGIFAYAPLPAACRLMAWVKPWAQPGSHRLHARWEVVIVYVPEGRRSNRDGRGAIPDVLIAGPGGGFIGAKPMEWTHWVLDALGYDPETDDVTDCFPGSGGVGRAVAQTRLQV